MDSLGKVSKILDSFEIVVLLKDYGMLMKIGAQSKTENLSDLLFFLIEMAQLTN
jgi:hypothetical protein